jgi:hypothetical protein
MSESGISGRMRTCTSGLLSWSATGTRRTRSSAVMCGFVFCSVMLCGVLRNPHRQRRRGRCGWRKLIKAPWPAMVFEKISWSRLNWRLWSRINSSRTISWSLSSHPTSDNIDNNLYILPFSLDRQEISSPWLAGCQTQRLAVLPPPQQDREE